MHGKASHDIRIGVHYGPWNVLLFGLVQFKKKGSKDVENDGVVDRRTKIRNCSGVPYKILMKGKLMLNEQYVNLSFFLSWCGTCDLERPCRRGQLDGDDLFHLLGLHWVCVLDSSSQGPNSLDVGNGPRIQNRSACRTPCRV